MIGSTLRQGNLPIMNSGQNPQTIELTAPTEEYDEKVTRAFANSYVAIPIETYLMLFRAGVGNKVMSYDQARLWIRWYTWSKSGSRGDYTSYILPQLDVEESPFKRMLARARKAGLMKETGWCYRRAAGKEASYYKGAPPKNVMRQSICVSMSPCSIVGNSTMWGTQFSYSDHICVQRAPLLDRRLNSMDIRVLLHLHYMYFKERKAEKAVSMETFAVNNLAHTFLKKTFSDSKSKFSSIKKVLENLCKLGYVRIKLLKKQVATRTIMLMCYVPAGFTERGDGSLSSAAEAKIEMFRRKQHMQSDNKDEIRTHPRRSKEVRVVAGQKEMPDTGIFTYDPEAYSRSERAMWNDPVVPIPYQESWTHLDSYIIAMREFYTKHRKAVHKTIQKHVRSKTGGDGWLRETYNNSALMKRLGNKAKEYLYPSGLKVSERRFATLNLSHNAKNFNGMMSSRLCTDEEWHWYGIHGDLRENANGQMHPGILGQKGSTAKAKAINKALRALYIASPTLGSIARRAAGRDSGARRCDVDLESYRGKINSMYEELYYRAKFKGVEEFLYFAQKTCHGHYLPCAFLAGMKTASIRNSKMFRMWVRNNRAAIIEEMSCNTWHSRVFFKEVTDVDAAIFFRCSKHQLRRTMDSVLRRLAGFVLATLCDGCPPKFKSNRKQQSCPKLHSLTAAFNC